MDNGSNAVRPQTEAERILQRFGDVNERLEMQNAGFGNLVDRLDVRVQSLCGMAPPVPASDPSTAAGAQAPKPAPTFFSEVVDSIEAADRGLAHMHRNMRSLEQLVEWLEANLPTAR